MPAVVFFDMDGLLADFVGGAARVHGRALPDPCPWDFYLEWCLTDAEFWAPLANRQFWATLNPLGDGASLFWELRKTVGVDDPFIRLAVLSSGACPGSVDGKGDWLARVYPSLSKAAVYTPHKELCAGPGKVLIDDHEPNVERFRKAGGRAVLVPRPWNSRAGECRPGGTFDPLAIAGEVFAAL